MPRRQRRGRARRSRSRCRSRLPRRHAPARARDGRGPSRSTTSSIRPQRVRAEAGRITLRGRQPRALGHTLHVSAASRELWRSDAAAGRARHGRGRSREATTSSSASSATTRSSACTARWRCDEARRARPLPLGHGQLRDRRDGGHRGAPRGPGGHDRQRRRLALARPAAAAGLFDNDARTLRVVRERERFGVNVLGAGQEELARLFASKVPEEEKFAGVAHTRPRRIPVLEGALAWVGCRLERLVAGGDHTIGIGAVEARRRARAPAALVPGALPDIHDGRPRGARLGADAVNLGAGALGAWHWWRVTVSRAFWPLLRAGQALVVLQAIYGGVLVAGRARPPGAAPRLRARADRGLVPGRAAAPRLGRYCAPQRASPRAARWRTCPRTSSARSSRHRPARDRRDGGVGPRRGDPRTARRRAVLTCDSALSNTPHKVLQISP